MKKGQKPCRPPAYGWSTPQDSGGIFHAGTFIDEGRISRPAAKRRRRLSPRRPVKTHAALTPASFEKFLCWLSEDWDEAGRKYEQIRTKMVKFFTWRGCHIPEELF